jgi:hypothetical protein
MSDERKKHRFRLEPGRSYFWWILPYAVVLFGETILCTLLAARCWSILALPALMAFMLICELRSGLALDSEWRASYAKGTWQYSAIIGCNAIALIAFLAASYWLLFLIAR